MCGTYEAMEAVFKNDPAAKARYEQSQKDFQKKYEAVIEEQKAVANSNTFNRTANTQTTYYIPVVVHVLLPNPALVTDAQIESQLLVLNQAYSGTNSDISLVPAWFQSVTSYGGSIQFCMAKRDPNGNSTNGIVRVSTSSTFPSGGNHPSTASASWNTQKYLNIWVCNMGNSGVIGYSYLPGTFTPGDPKIGFVNDYRCFGTTGTAGGAPYSSVIYGKTAVHEIGHYLNLQHTWGPNNCSGPQSCTDDDGVDDTPLEYTCNQSSPAPGNMLYDQCTSTAPGLMWMNYMDYSGDNSVYMFSKGQDTRMVTALTSHPERVGLITNNSGCIPVGLNIDAGITSITNPTDGSIICTNNTIPVVIFTNGGVNTLTSVTFTITLNGGSPITYNWTGSLSSMTSIEVTLPNVGSIPLGNNTLTICTSSPNGSTDQYSGNDCKTITFTVPNASTSATLPLIEGFENATFPPTGWLVINPDNGTTWLRTTGARKSGTACAYINNRNYSSAGQIDFLRTPMINFSSSVYTIANMTFHYAYRQYNTSLTDTLEVVVSTDCGGSWQSVWKKGGADLATVTPSSVSSFFPSNSQWSSSPAVVDLSAFIDENIYIAFRNKNGNGQYLYIDDVAIGEQAVPVKLISFTGISVSRSINNLYWKTASEINAQSFVIERSNNGIEFNSIGEVLAKGSDTKETAYFYTDNNVQNNTNYYRLKQTDKNGSYEYSKIIVLKTNEKRLELTNIYPNPANDKLFLKTYSGIFQKMGVQIMDIQGRVVIALQPISLSIGETISSVDVSKLKAGVYLIKMIGSNEQTIKFYKN